MVPILLFAWIVIAVNLSFGQQRRDIRDLNAEVKNMCTGKRRHCKIMPVYSGVTQGSVIQTTQYGQAFVKDYKIGKRKIVFYRYDHAPDDGRKKKKVVKKVRSVTKLVIWVEKGSMLRKPNGKPNLKTVTLDEAETKKVMIEQLVRRRQFDWILLIYPEERQHIRELIYRYSFPSTPDPAALP
jgi:hypothetical protein